MDQHTAAKIFPASERGCTETDWFRAYSTFHFGSYRAPHKEAFRQLYVLNDDTLAAQKTLTFAVEQDSTVILLPLVGAIDYRDEQGRESLTAAGELQLTTHFAGDRFTIANPYIDDPVNSLQVWIASSPRQRIFEQHKIMLDSHPNALATILKSVDFSLSIGKFAGRAETSYRMQADGAGLFAFAVQGAFEFQNRLIETRDGLALWNTAEVEMEALSNEAIILLIELNEGSPETRKEV